MKAKTILFIAALCVTGSLAVAQAPNANDIKLLPGASKGIVKVIYPFATEEGIDITFSNDNGIVGTDKIRGSFSKGVMKKYDVTNIDRAPYRVTVSSREMSTTYRIVATRKGKHNFVAIREEISYKEPVVASR